MKGEIHTSATTVRDRRSSDRVRAVTLAYDSNTLYQFTELYIMLELLSLLISLGDSSWGTGTAEFMLQLSAYPLWC